MDYLDRICVPTVCIVIGTTTCGCVRARWSMPSAANYRVSVVEEGCADRSQATHAVNLCDMHAKYADVVASPEVIAYINGLPNGLFDLPKGDASAGRVFAPDQPASKIAAE